MKMGHPLEVAIVVAHPDDEIIWAGGTILLHQEWQGTVLVLCRGSDPDRAPKFRRVLEHLGISGNIGDLNDGPEQTPLSDSDVQKAVLALLPARHFDLILTHSPFGEYTRHLRHEETGRAVTTLWTKGVISAAEIWLFAYEDNGGQLSRPIKTAHRKLKLPEGTWRHKYDIITGIYGFDADSLEARMIPREEAFWCFRTANDFHEWLAQSEGRA
jgi:LmbE family N-acetylglucosaminyl deacetylase